MAIIPKGGGGKPEEEKTVTAGTSVIEVIPSSGKTMKKVTVNPTPSQSKTVSPSTSQQTVSPDAGKLLSQVIVNAMATGALSDITVSSAGLITAQVGTSGYLASGTKKTKQLTVQASKTVTPSESEQTAVARGRYTTGAIKVAAIPSKYVDLATKLGISNFEIGSFTPSSDGSVTVQHNLGVKPYLVLIFADKSDFVSTRYNDIAELLFGKNKRQSSSSDPGYQGSGIVQNTNASETSYGYTYLNSSTRSSSSSNSMNESQFITPAYLQAGIKYYWFAIA